MKENLAYFHSGEDFQLHLADIGELERQASGEVGVYRTSMPTMPRASSDFRRRDEVHYLVLGIPYIHAHGNIDINYYSRQSRVNFVAG
jgi:hypothetical protein